VGGHPPSRPILEAWNLLLSKGFADIINYLVVILENERGHTYLHTYTLSELLT